MSKVSPEAASLDPQRLIEIIDVISYALKDGCKVYFTGASDELIREFAEGCRYRRGHLDCFAYAGTAENGDVVIKLDDADVPAGVFVISFCGEGMLSCPADKKDAEDVLRIICAAVERDIFGVKAVFMDRDDTINDDIGHCTKPEDLSIFPFVPDALKRLNDAGYMTILITNQSVIGRGWIDEKGLDLIHDKMRQDILPGKLDDIFYCPHVPDGGCDCRKPKIGLGMKALERYCINTRISYMIGDSDRDIQFGEGIGCESIKVDEKFTFADAVEQILNPSDTV